MTSPIADAALSLSRWLELSILAKATVMLVLGLVAVRLAVRTQASVRHLLLSATFATLLVLPPLAVTVPSLVVRVPVVDSNARLAVRVVEPSNGPPVDLQTGDRRTTPASPTWASVISWLSVVRVGWIAGTAALGVSLGAGLLRLRRVRRTSLPRPDLRAIVRSLADRAGVRRPIDVLEHEGVAAPLTCGLWRPAIVLPTDSRDWTDADLRRALIHELEHVRRGDWAMQVAARAACACYWFHPLVWTAWRRLCLEAERACDDGVVHGAERTDYADQLVMLARRLSHGHSPTLVGMANRSDLSARVAALLDDRQRRGRAGLFAAASAAIVAAVVVLTIAPVRTVAALSPVEAAASEQRSIRGDMRSRRAAPLDRALYEAAESGDLADVDQLIQAGANVNAALGGDGSPLIAAARANRLATVRRLLDRGADVNMPVPGDGNPLIAAAREGSASVVTLLLDRGASIDQMVEGDENALIQASGGGHLDVVKLLVARGADVNARVFVERPYGRSQQGEWRTSLSMARRGRHAAVVAFLLASGARE